MENIMQYDDTTDIMDDISCLSFQRYYYEWGMIDDTVDEMMDD